MKKNKSKLYAVLREPLLHFLLIGTALFFAYYQLNDAAVDNDKSIRITKADLDKLSAAWFKSKGRTPSYEEKQEQLDNFIQEQILYSEAVARDLDKNDETVRIHLANKMKFVFDDLSFIAEPTDEELRKFLSDNSSKFMESAAISFNQIVFTQDKASADIYKDAKQFLQKLKNSSSSKISAIGDKVELSKKAISNIFGEEFASAAFVLPIKSWQEPIRTKHGVHLIYIHSRTNEHVPELSDIRENVLAQWRKKKRDEANEIFYKNLYKDYEIIIDDKSGK
jgi:parvulin-like peptidyl-prolyl isomerase